MTIRPITDKVPACFGVVCSLHGQCARYAAVEGSQADPNTIATCETKEGYPLFRWREAVATTTPQLEAAT